MAILSYSVFILQCLGVWYFGYQLTGWKAKLYICYTIFVVAVVYSFTLSHSIMLYQSINNASEFADASFLLFSLIVTCGKMFNMIYKRKVIAVMMKAFQAHPFNPHDERESQIYDEYDRTTKFFTLLYGILTESTCIMFILTSLNRDVSRRELSYKAWFPFDITTSTRYWIAYSHQTLGIIFGAKISITFDTVVLSLMIMTCGQLKVFNHRFGKIHEIIACNRNSTDGTRDEKQIRAKKKFIADCTRHHISIYESKMIEKTFAVSLFLQYCAGALVLCTITYNLSQIKSYNIEYFSLILYLMCILSQMFIFCRYATEVGYESGKICDAIYATDWASLNVATQSSLIIIMARTIHPIEFKKGNIIFSLDSFCHLLKLSYSVYNVLQHSSH